MRRFFLYRRQKRIIVVIVIIMRGWTLVVDRFSRCVRSVLVFDARRRRRSKIDDGLSLTTTTFRMMNKSIATSARCGAGGYSFGVIGGGTPSEITPVDDFVGGEREKPKAKPTKRAATAQGSAQTEATDNRIGRGNANTIKEKPKDERIGQTHLLDILKREKEKSSNARVNDNNNGEKRNMPSFAFCGVGGLDDHFATLFRRVFASRMIDPAVAKKMELEHVRGVLLHGPPGTGKTLVAKAPVSYTHLTLPTILLV